MQSALGKGGHNMRVLMLDLFLPDSTYTKELVERLKKYVDIDLVCTSNVTEQIDGVNVLPKFYAPGKGVAKGIGEYVKGLHFISRLLHKNSYQIFHVQTFKNDAVEIPFYIRLMKHHPETKFVVTAHNIAPHEAPEKTKDLYQNLYDACDLIVVHNKDCRNRLMRDYYIPYDKILLMPHGAYSVPEEEARKHTKKNSVVSFLFFGCIRKYKGLDILLKAIALLPDDVKSRCRFTIAGERLRLDETDYIQMAEELKIQDFVSFQLCHIPEEELPALFEKVDFCIYPYREISGSGALLMAFSYGVPVIAASLLPFREETDHGAAGILCEPENPEALAKAICSAVNMPQEKYQNMSNGAQKQAEKHSWDVSAKLLKNGYRRTYREDVFVRHAKYQQEKRQRRKK